MARFADFWSIVLCCLSCLVTDAESPVVSCPSDVSSNTDAESAEYMYSWSSSGVDNVDGSVSSTCNVSSPHGFSVGTSVVVCTSSDGSGNVGSCSFSVTVTGKLREW